MTIDEATRAFEKDFQVSEVVGYAAEKFEARGGALDMARSPSNLLYVTLTSGGVAVDGEAMRALFDTEAAAAAAWLGAAWVYAEERGGKELFWCLRPVYREEEYIAVRQASLIGDRFWRGSIALKMGAVHSRLVISKGSE